MGRAILLLASSVMLAALAGCALGHHGQHGGGCCPTADEVALPNVERTGQESMVQELAGSIQPGTTTELVNAGHYRALSPQQCQCLAAKHAPLADGFDRQRQELQSQRSRGSCRSHDTSAKQRAYQDALLLYTALESRDQAAGGALEWYYQLAGAEAKTDLLDASLEHGRKLLQDMERLKQLEIALPAPIEDYTRQVAEIELQQAQNQLSIEQLNAKLRVAMGFETSQPWHILPDPGMPLGGEVVPDVEAAVKLGLTQRPQLVLLRYMIDHLDGDTLGSSRSFLQTLNPLLAMSRPGPNSKLLIILTKLLHLHRGQDDEVERVRAQLCELLHERERTIEAEIREAAFELGARRQAILLAREAAASWEKRLRDLQTKQQEKMPVFADLARAYQESFKARGEVVKEFMGWKIAVVQLKQVQGILPSECGYPDCTQNNACHHESHEEPE